MVKLTRAGISGHRTLCISLSNATLDTLGEWWELIYLLYVSLDQMPTGSQIGMSLGLPPDTQGSSWAGAGTV